MLGGFTSSIPGELLESFTSSVPGGLLGGHCLSLTSESCTVAVRA